MGHPRVQWSIGQLTEFQRLWNEDKVSIKQMPALLGMDVSVGYLSTVAYKLRKKGFYFKPTRRHGRKQTSDVVTLAKLANLQRERKLEK